MLPRGRCAEQDVIGQRLKSRRSPPNSIPGPCDILLHYLMAGIHLYSTIHRFCS